VVVARRWARAQGAELVGVGWVAFGSGVSLCRCKLQLQGGWGVSRVLGVLGCVKESSDKRQLAQMTSQFPFFSRGGLPQNSLCVGTFIPGPTPKKGRNDCNPPDLGLPVCFLSPQSVSAGSSQHGAQAGR
jgi:hypothetical protein